MRTINKTYAIPDGGEDEDNEVDGAEEGEGTGEGSGESDSGVKAYVWISLVEAVSDLTKYDFEKVFQMPAIEFFTFMNYAKYKSERERRRIEAINKRTRV